ncbi:helix-turn-helix domain-containing protein [Pseudactinotalea suaedae]|uniref:helix-turn-helix domain-containing protein n=1 Tax=Pseudactinotalea suaedae TaxID=1524924 RepID=UPI001F501BF4|nr:helix-turn-helix domain-containing protein [Pseudactinotalea suaedae]
MSKPDRLNDVERAHLVDPADDSFRIARLAPSPAMASLVRRFWMPVWSVPGGGVRTQQVLQYPCALIVVSHSYARFYGVASGLSRTDLEGTGWACGVMLQPATGHLLTGRSMRELRDRHVPLSDVLPGGEALVTRVRRTLGPDPGDGERQRAAAGLLEAELEHLLPIGEQAQRVNDVVAYVEGKPDLVRVSGLVEAFATTERSLQRLTGRWLGLTPRWLVQRRRLHEAAERLRHHEVDLARVAADLGYADQAHFTRDWRRVTGMTPGRFAARFAAPDERRPRVAPARDRDR